jgi:hypothetical protein
VASSRSGDEILSRTFLNIHFLTSHGGAPGLVGRFLEKGKEDEDMTVLYYHYNSLSGEKLAELKISQQARDRQCYDLQWQQLILDPDFLLQDCIELKTKASRSSAVVATAAMKNGKFGDDDSSAITSWWYGGGERFDSIYASSSLDAKESVQMDIQPFQSSDIYSARDKIGGVLQAVWFNSDGWSISVEDDVSNAPLWISMGSTEVEALNGTLALCLRSDWTNYTITAGAKNGGRGGGRDHFHTTLLPRPTFDSINGSTTTTSAKATNEIELLPLKTLRYTVCKDDNVKESWEKRIRNTVENQNQDKESPNIDMIEKPIWSTWAEFKKGKLKEV